MRIPQAAPALCHKQVYIKYKPIGALVFLHRFSGNSLPKSKSGLFWIALLLGCYLAIPAPVTAQAAVTSSILPLAVNLEDIQWGPPGGGNGVPAGTRTAQQGVDPVTGGVTYFAQFPAGTRFDPHWHTHDEFVSVVKGPVTIVLGGQTHVLEAGAYVVIPGGMVHSWIMSAATEATILVRRAGPADFHFTGEP